MPNRVLRDWTASEVVNKLSPGAEILFTRLIMKADDYGNYPLNPKLIKSILFPLKSYSLRQVEGWISECIQSGVIQKYTVENAEFINIPNFGQRLRTMTGKYPPPPADIPPSIDGQLSDIRPPETKRNEVETKQETKRGEISLSDFENLLKNDELWMDTIVIVHKGKDIEQAIKQAYLHMQNKKTLERGELSDFKGCVQSFLNNEKPGNGMVPKLSIGEQREIDRKRKLNIK